MKKSYMEYKKLLGSTKGLRMLILFISFFVLCGLLVMTIANTYDQTQQKNRQLAALEQDLQKEKEKHEALITQKEYYESDTFIEKEARNTLGLSLPNEQIYILKKLTPTVTPSPPSTETSDAVKGKSMLEKWLILIFG